MKRTSVFLLFLLALVVGACVFPTRLADDKPFGEPFIGFIEPGKTSKTQIEIQLGAPNRESSDGRWWAYHADHRTTEWGWFICVPTGCGADEFGGELRHYNLVIEFSKEDVAKRSAVVTDRRPCTRDRTLCYSDGELTVETLDTSVTLARRDVGEESPASKRRKISP